MTWPELNISIECEPRENGINNWIYEWWIKRMPIKYVQSHVALTGEVFTTLNVRMPETLPERGAQPVEIIRQVNSIPGYGHFSYNTGLSGGRVGAIGMVYGKVYEDMDGTLSFKVVERDMEKLKEAGRRIWQAFYKTKQIITAEVRVKK
jgi:hypothetical protein